MKDIEEDVDSVIDRFLREQCGLLEWSTSHFISFVGENFAGKSGSAEIKIGELSQTQLRGHAIERLSFGTNKPFDGARSIEKLWLAHRALSILICNGSEPTFPLQLWRFRLLQIWASILPERDTKLKQQSDELITSIDEFARNSHPNPDQITEYFIEKVHFHTYYFEYSLAKCAFDRALQIAGIEEIILTGALGRRTRFQQNSMSQLLLKVKFNDAPQCNSVNAQREYLPHNCKSADDTLLEHTIFDDASEQERQQLSLAQCACLLAFALLQRFLDVSTRELGTEAIMVYLDEVIRQQSCWALQTRALIERSHLEMTNSRRVERACAQLETIEQSLSSSNCDMNVFDKRLEFLFGSAPLPFWKVGTLHAKVLLSLGCVSEALRLFEKLEMWDEVAECYLGLGQSEKAEFLVRQMMEQRPEQQSVYLCLLGDITGNAEYFLKALQVSNDDNARAHSSLGKHFLRKKQYANSMEHFSRSVEIQPLQTGIWFNLGYAAMKAADYQTSIRAFHRCVSIEPEHFEAWNNLAASYTKLGQKHRAQKIILEALKLNWEDRHVWENLLIISADIKDYNQAIGAMEKLLDLDQKGSLDELPLEVVATELINNEQSDAKLLQSLLSIFSRVHARQSLSPRTLRTFARMKRPTEEQLEDLTAWTAYTKLLEKAFQREYGHSSSLLEPKICAKMLKDLRELIVQLGSVWRIQKLRPEEVKAQLRLRVQSKITLLEREFGEDCAYSGDDELKEEFGWAKKLLA